MSKNGLNYTKISANCCQLCCQKLSWLYNKIPAPGICSKGGNYVYSLFSCSASVLSVLSCSAVKWGEARRASPHCITCRGFMRFSPRFHRLQLLPVSGSSEGRRTNDLQFHYALIRSTHNAFLTRMVQGMYAFLSKSLKNIPRKFKISWGYNAYTHRQRRSRFRKPLFFTDRFFP